MNDSLIDFQMMAAEMMAAGDEHRMAKKLWEMGSNLNTFSSSIRCVLEQQSIQHNLPYDNDFRRLREGARDDAMVYLNGVLPYNQNLMSKINTFFAACENYSFEEWEDNICGLKTLAGGFRDECQKLVRIHEDIMVSLKQREDDAAVLRQRYRELDRSYHREATRLEESASTKTKWAVALAFVPVVNFIATPLLLSSSSDDEKDARIANMKSDSAERASDVVGNIMIPAFTDFISGISSISYELSNIAADLCRFGNGRYRYKIFVKKAQLLKESSQLVLRVLPHVRNNLESIPNNGTNWSYVNRMLGRQKEIMQ